VASTPRYFDKQSGAWKDGEALFMRCDIWRAAAENVAESCKRGQRVVVTGQLVQRSFETREGEKRTVVEVKADEVAVSLKYGTAAYTKTARAGGGGDWGSSSGDSGGWGGGTSYDDPWGSAPPAGQPQADDEPPF
jgi:single-strand DNA-binding protein